MPAKYCDHQLIGNLADFRECYIEGDWLLIYQMTFSEEGKGIGYQTESRSQKQVGEFNTDMTPLRVAEQVPPKNQTNSQGVRLPCVQVAHKHLGQRPYHGTCNIFYFNACDDNVCARCHGIGGKTECIPVSAHYDFSIMDEIPVRG